MSGHCKHCGYDGCVCDEDLKQFFANLPDEQYYQPIADKPSCHRCNGFLEPDATCANYYCPNFTFKPPMNELFNLEPSESPRLKWMRKHDINVNEINHNHYTVTKGMKYVGQADSMDAALFLAAKRLGILLWNEEGIDKSAISE